VERLRADLRAWLVSVATDQTGWVPVEPEQTFTDKVIAGGATERPYGSGGGSPRRRALGGGFQNEIVLSHEFFKEIMSHPIPTDMEAAKALSCSLAALDLFMWLSYRCFVAKGRERVPLFGDFGLVSQLGSSNYARPRKFRERLEGWLDLVREMWPECPAAMDTTGTGLWVDRASAVLPTGGTNVR
jgi:hypothetical protein